MFKIVTKMYIKEMIIVTHFPIGISGAGSLGLGEEAV